MRSKPFDIVIVSSLPRSVLYHQHLHHHHQERYVSHHTSVHAARGKQETHFIHYVNRHHHLRSSTINHAHTGAHWRPRRRLPPRRVGRCTHAAAGTLFALFRPRATNFNSPNSKLQSLGDSYPVSSAIAILPSLSLPPPPPRPHFSAADENARKQSRDVSLFVSPPATPRSTQKFSLSSRARRDVAQLPLIGGRLFAVFALIVGEMLLTMHIALMSAILF